MIGRALAASAAAFLLFSGCGGGSSSPVTTKHFVLDLPYRIPFPNDLLFLPAANEPADGTLNLPYTPNSPEAAMIRSVDRLDGFSTTAPILVPTDTVVEPTSLFGKIHIYQAKAFRSSSSPLPTATQIEQELSSSSYAFFTFGDSIVIEPKVPLQGNKEYIIAITKGVVDINGEGLGPDRITALLLNDAPLFDDSGNPLYEIPIQTLQKIESLRPYYHHLVKITGLLPQSIATIFSFKTQTIGKVAKNLASQSYDTRLILHDSGYSVWQMLSPSQASNDVMGNAQVYVGQLQNLPYYLGRPSAYDPIAPLTQEMKLQNFKPMERSKVTIPVLAAIPKSCPMPQRGWPVVIFQHGITQNRTNLLAVAGSFAKACYASVAIDLPLHGITDPSSPLYQGKYERTFNLDLLTQDAECNVVAFEPDGKIDCSGSYYINLANAAVSRDNMRQTTADLAGLLHALPNAVGVKFDGSRVAFAGHSLGAMAPFGFLANKKVQSAVLANPGAGIVPMLLASPTFGPTILEALSQTGIQPDSKAMERYIILSQTLVDDADPINYAKPVARMQRSLIFEVRGDEVIPNSVPGYPLSGTDPLIRVMGAKALPIQNAPGLIQVPKVTYSKFIIGEHSSILRPSFPEVTQEMHRQMVSFIQSGGTKVLVKDLSILE